MTIEINSQTENKLLERKEISATVKYKGSTPNRKDIRSLLGGKIGANPELVVLKKVTNEFGIEEIKIRAHVYDKAESMKKNEAYHLLVRDGLAQKKEKKKKEKKATTPKKS